MLVSFRGCTCLKCTNQSRIVPTDKELHQPRGRTICSVGAAETAAPPGCAPTEFRCLGCVSIRSGGLRPPQQAEDNHNCDLVLRRPETSATVGAFKNSFHPINPLSMFSASESVVKKHVIFCVFFTFLPFYSFTFTRKYNTRKLPRKSSFYRNRTRNQKVACPSSKGVHLSQVHRLLC